MVEFGKFVQKKSKSNPADLINLFETLDRKASHTELRPVQVEALQNLIKKRLDRDCVLKISTGAGKTTVALLYLQSFMEELEEPVVYLCPTLQLVDQVLNEAVKLGIKAMPYPKGEKYPSVECTTAKAIIVCTYAKLFNALTTFDRSDVHLRPCAIVLDDAHAGVEEIRDSFTLRINRGDKSYEPLMKIFDSLCEAYHSSAWQSIRNDDPLEALEIPFWIWQPIVAEAAKIIGSEAHNPPFVFVWPYLRDILRWCRCVVSGRGIEIVPDILPIEKVAAYFESKHRLFMSATLADDSVLIRELGCKTSAAINPIVLPSDRGLGERMVLAPVLISKTLDRNWVIELCGRLKKHNVVVLSPSEERAREWESAGATVVMGDDVSIKVEELRQSAGGEFVVFVQRYDGVDLPDTSCRVLVIDGMPFGEGIVDKHDSDRFSVVGGMRSRLIYRIEQGMGRAVRSHADYAVVILAGADLANFVAKKEVQNAMSSDTKDQLKLAIELTDLAKSEEKDEGKRDAIVIDMIRKSLQRNEGWKQFYDEKVRKGSSKESKNGIQNHFKVAEAERKSWKLISVNKHNEAVELLRKAIFDNGIVGKEQGLFLQRVANYLYYVNETEALEIQCSAYEKHNALFCPPALVKRPISIEKIEVPIVFLEWFKQFANPNGAIAAHVKLRGELLFEGNVNVFENAVSELAYLVGAVGSRPEKEISEGPDVLWLWKDLALVIEVKTENQKSLHKKDAAQLLHSLEWFRQKYGTGKYKIIPVVVAKVLKVDSGVSFPDETRIVSPETLSPFLNNVEKMLQELINSPLFQNPKMVSKIFENHHLSPEEFLGKYTIKLNK